jgi:hypothetical protein
MSKFNGSISELDVSNVIQMNEIFYSSFFKNDISDWVFNPDLKIDKDTRRVLENSHNWKREKEVENLKLMISDLNLSKKTTL